MQLNYLESGKGEKTAFLLHGLFGSASNLTSVANVLAEEYRVFRIDLRNHGGSFHLDSMTIPEMADDIRRLADSLGIEKITLVGHSLGGKVAMQFALNWPERVERLVVADIAPITYKPHHSEILDALTSIDLRALKSRSEADAVLAKVESELGVRQFLLKNLTRDSNGGWRWKLNLSAINEAYDDLRQAPEGEPFSKPTLFIRGELSNYIKDEYRNEIHRRFPNSQLETIPGTGHWLHAEKPAHFNGLVKEFLIDAL